MINISYSEVIKHDYYENLSHRRFKKYSNQTLKEIYEKEFQEVFGVNLYGLLCGEFDEICKIKVLGKDCEKIFDIFDYSGKFQGIISAFFTENIEVHTCHFCNIDFINIFQGIDGKIKSGFTLDHFLSKSNNPHLALSLNNLVPSCYICNSKIKLSKNIGDRPPTSKSFKFDDKVKFKVFLKNKSLSISTPEDFDLLLKEDFSNKYADYIKILQLDQRYQYHKYKIVEILEKRKAYPASRIKELANLTSKTESEVMRDLFGNHIKEHLYKLPFSKLIKDILDSM